MRTPYTTRTGVRIGCMYQPPNRVTVSRDAYRLQEALLRDSLPQRRSSARPTILAIAALAAVLAITFIF